VREKHLLLVLMSTIRLHVHWVAVMVTLDVIPFRIAHKVTSHSDGAVRAHMSEVVHVSKFVL
jgi:hypothetical protein